MLGVVFEPLGGIRSTPFFLINIVLIVGSIFFCACSSLYSPRLKYYSRRNQKVLHHRETCIHREPAAAIIIVKRLSSVEFWRHQSDRNKPGSTHTLHSISETLKPFCTYSGRCSILDKKRKRQKSLSRLERSSLTKKKREKNYQETIINTSHERNLTSDDPKRD